MALQDFSNWREDWATGICPFCSNRFKGAQGVRVHISNSHPQQSQDIKLSFRKRQVISGQTTAATSLSRSDSIDFRTPSTSDEHPNDGNNSLPSLEPWVHTFQSLLDRGNDPELQTLFDEEVDKFSAFLVDSLNNLKGPKHPSVKFYKARRAGLIRTRRARFHRTTNPQRRDRRRREKTKEQYKYQLVQFQFHNSRKRAVNHVLNPTDKNVCKTPMCTVESHFQSLLETPNDQTRDCYVPVSNDSIHDNNDIESFTTEEVRDALKGMSVDTSPGPDNVVLRTIKSLHCENVVALIATIMYRYSIVPKSFQQGRTVLVPKTGDPNNLGNWRPITIFSVLRRLVERALDRRVKRLVDLSPVQRGFVNVPGTHINSTLVNGALKSAKKLRKNCVIVFLDISKAFDNIGHSHLRRTLESLPLPIKLRKLVLKLCEENTVQIQVGHNKTRPIRVRRGVPQGAPLSPTIFNLCIDFILQELTDPSLATEYGYQLKEGLAAILALAFADDIALIANSTESAKRLVEVVTASLNSIGLELNTSKSKAIVVEEGQLVYSPEGLSLNNGQIIDMLESGEKIRYLGVDFQGEIVLDEVALFSELKRKVDLLTTTSLLHPEQKLIVLNQFIWPTLVYTLQCAPLSTIKTGFLEDVDKLLRGAAKQICGLPMDTPTSMMYSPIKFRGLGLFRASWEAFLQHASMASKLENLSDPVLAECRDFQAEIKHCLSKLDLPAQPDDADSTNFESRFPSAKVLRVQLREREFQSWCSLPVKGQGVEVFSEMPVCNKWVTDKTGLSSSEWTNALKMSTNGCNLRSNPRVSPSTIRCRHCSEFETLAHVLGACPRGELLRNRRHHQLCDRIAEQLRKRQLDVTREDHVVTAYGSRYCDLLVIDQKNLKGYILDPTVRFEKSKEQAVEVDVEKRGIYETTIPVYQERHPSIVEWHVFGLFFGARGAIPSFTANIVRGFGLTTDFLRQLSLDILKNSLGILNHHIYTRN